MEVKNCPFCGSQASLMDIDDLYTAHGDDCVEYRVMCSRCEATTGGDDGYTTAEAALGAWNQRTNFGG